MPRKEWRQEEFDDLIAQMVDMLVDHITQELPKKDRKKWAAGRFYSWGNFSKLRIDMTAGAPVVEMHPPSGPDLAFFALLDEARKMRRRRPGKWTAFLLTFTPDKKSTVEFKHDEDMRGFFSS
jgi:hypothetical protein